MKATLLASLAGLGIARRPLGTPEAAPPAKLLPWREPSAAAERCGGPVGYLDILCGTEAYCDAFTFAPDQASSGPGFRFRTTDACLQAHQPPPGPGERAAPGPAAGSLRWIQNGSDVRQCGLAWGFITDRNCGTRRYCDAHDTVGLARTDQQFATTDACLRAHEEDPFGPEAPPPPPPWVEPADPEALCGIYSYEEAQCGTARYCWAFDHDREFTDGAFRSEAHCRASRRPPPPDAAPLRTKLAWKQPGRGADRCNKNRFWDVPRCGTRLFCDAFDLYRNETMGRFRKAIDCYTAFEKEPSAVHVHM